MGWYRRSKLAWGAIQSAAMGSKFLARNPFPPPKSGKIYPLAYQWKMEFSGSSLLSSRFKHATRLNHTPRAHLLDSTTRFYHVDRSQVYHFRPRGYKRWFENPRNALIVVLLGSGCVITVYFGNLETIPYTKRTHFVLLSKDFEKQLGESQFKQIKGTYKGKILPAIHPDSVRVRLITKDVIEALQRGISHELAWSDPEYSSQAPDLGRDFGAHETLKLLGEEKELNMTGNWRKEDEILDDKWVDTSREKGEARGAQPTTKHLEHANWEVVVVDDPMVNAFCLPGGKIVVFTGLLRHFTTDAEIATVIGHEVGHVVARHAAEQVTKNMYLAIVQLILYQFVMPDVVNTMSNLLLKLPFSRKMEIEADYIGLLLTASAGYDPRIAPTVYEKLGKVGGGDSALRDYLSTHPSGKRRAQLLAQAQVMQEAMNLYREKASGRRIQGWFPGVLWVQTIAETWEGVSILTCNLNFEIKLPLLVSVFFAPQN
ncbi:hypothetical protein V2J09_016195 [Rumex salicifolius]